MESTQTSVTAEEIRRWCLHVVDAPVEAADPELVDQLRELEVLKAAVEARQARIALRFDSSQRAHAAARGVPAARQARGIAEQIALARRVSPHRGRILLGLAGVVLREMPCTA